MRIVVDTTVNDDTLPFIEPGMQLLRPSALAVYDMQSTRDLAGNVSLGFTGSFSNEGAVITSNDMSINTNVLEKDEMTFLLCCNIDPRPGTAFSVMSNMTPFAAPFSGLRQVRSADGSGNFSAGTGLPVPNQVTSINNNVVGAWTIRIMRVKNDEISSITRGGTLTKAAITSRVKSTYPLFLNAVPPEVSTPTQTGSTGTIGLFCAYNEYLSDADSAALMNIGASIMATRGIIL